MITPEAFVHYKTGNASADAARWQIIQSAYESVNNSADVTLVRADLRQLQEKVTIQFQREEDLFAHRSYRHWHTEDHRRIESALSTMITKMHESMPAMYKYNIRDWVRLLTEHIESHDFQAERDTSR